MVVSPLSRSLVGLLVVLIGLFCTPVQAQDDGPDDVPTDVPVAVSATVEADDVALTGSCTLSLAFAVEEDVGRPYVVVLRLRSRDNSIDVDLDHRPDPPTVTWKAGATIRYDVPVRLPVRAEYEGIDRLSVRVSFRDPETRKLLPPRNGFLGSDQLVEIATVEPPDHDALDKTEDVDALIAAASALAKSGRKPAAWSALEGGLRRALEDTVKERFRDALIALGNFEPRPLSLVEQQIVEDRVDNERQRYLRQQSGRFFDRKQYHAALRILEAVGGKLSEDADKAVLGAVNDAKRVEKDKWDVRDKLLEQLTDEEKSKADEASARLGPGHELLKKAETWLKHKEYGAARRVMKDLSFAENKEVRDRAQELARTLDEQWTADTPPEQAALVAEALAHPSFPRTVPVVSQEFIFIGPKTLVESIPAESKLRYDIAYLFLTDLFGRLPNPDGDRVTVYFKELWDFGGGVGGGKTIDIGRADPNKRGQRVDNGLLYHELTHCIDDTTPILSGFREGLANVGAVYAYEALGQRDDGLHGFTTNMKAFHDDYLGRDMPYWRIQNYGPSAGFFLHFVDKYARTKAGASGAGHDWKRYRQFFREYRDAPVRDGREPYVARALAYYLVRAFGPGAFDDLMRFRFPLVESDRKAIELEMEAFADGENAVISLEDELEDFENTPLRRDMIARRLIQLQQAGGREAEVKRRARDELGVLHDWRVIGPFQEDGTDPGACVFPPQLEIDFDAEYPGKGNVCKWRTTGDPGPVQVDALGWVSIKYPYMDNTAQFALAHVTVEEDTAAAIHVRADDDFTLFVNGDLVDGYVDRGRNGSSMLWWRGPREKAPDAMRLPIVLHKGRNKLLLKIRNRGGPAGFVLAVTRAGGRPIAGMTSDVELPAPPTPPSVGEDDFKTALEHDFRSKSFGNKFEATVGSFQVQNKLLRGRDTNKRVGWRPYTVRPGFEKDSPSNLLWLGEKYTRGVDAFRLTLDLHPNGDDAPKTVITFQGDGGKDGLSGWNLILHGAGKGRAACELERYDTRFHQAVPIDMGDAGEDGLRRLVLTYVDRRLSVTIGDAVLFDRIPIRPIAGAERIGLCTWGADPGIARIEFEVPKGKR